MELLLRPVRACVDHKALTYYRYPFFLFCCIVRGVLFHRHSREESHPWLPSAEMVALCTGAHRADGERSEVHRQCGHCESEAVGAHQARFV